MKIYDPHITGSLSVSSSADIQGDLTVGGTIYGTAEIQGSVESATSASHAASYVLTSSYEIFTASVATTGSNTFIGDQTFSGSLIPEGTTTHDLGSDSKRWNDIYLAGSTVDIGGTKISKDSSGDVEIKDSDGNLKRLIASELEIGTGNNKIKIKRDNTGRVKILDSSDNTELSDLSGSFTGSFRGDGSALTNVPASAVSGLSLDRIASTTATASISPTELITNVSIIPSDTDTIDLGSPSKQWRDLYLSSGSLYINGQQVLSTTGTELRVTTDSGESIKILEEGSDTITLQSENGDITLTSSGTGNIELDAPIQITAGNKILSSDGNSIVFGNGLIITGSITLTGNVDGVDVGNFKSTFDTTTGSFDGRLDSLETNSGSQATSIGNLETFQTNVESGIQLTGSNVTIKGDLLVKGTETRVDSTTVDIADNIISLNGSGAVNAGIEVRDTESPGTTSGSLIYDTGDNQWKGGLKGSEKRLLDTDDKTTIDTSIDSLETESGSVKQRLNEVEFTTGSHNTRISSLETISGSHDGRLDSIETKTGSLTTDITTLDGRVDSLETKTGSLDTTNTNQNSRLSSLETKTGSIDTTNTNQGNRLDSIESFTGSLDATFASDEDVTTLRNDLNTYTSSNDTTNTNQNSRLSSIETFTGSIDDTFATDADVTNLGNRVGSIETFTSSIDTTIKTKLNTETVVSGSEQIDIHNTTGYVANENIDHSTITVGSGKGLSGGGSIDVSRSLTLHTGSAHFLDGVKSKLNTEGVISGSEQVTISDTNGYNTITDRLDSVEDFTASLDNTYATDADVTTLRGDLNTYTSSNDTTNTNQNSRLSSLETKTGSLDTTNTNQNSRLSSLETTSGSHDGRLDSLETTTGSLDTRITTEKNRVDAILSTADADKDSFAEIVALINSVDTQNDNAFATFYTASNNRLESLETTTGSHDGRLDSLEVKTGSIDERLGEIEFVTSSHDSRLDSLETKSGSVDTTNTTQNSRLSSLETKTGSLESTNTSQNSRLGSLETKTGSLDSTNTSQNSRLGSLETKTGSIDTINTNQDNRLDSIESFTGSLDNTYATDADVTTLRGDFNTHTASVDTTNTNQNSRLSSIETFTGSLDNTYATDADVTTLRGDLNTYTSSNDSTNTSQNSRLGSLETKTGSLDVVNSQQNNRLGSLETTSGSHDGRLDSIESKTGSFTTTDFYTTGATFNTSNGVITATRNDEETWTVDLDGRYLTSFTETDPVFDAHVASNITSTNISNWNTAYGWGDHSTEGYLKSFTETDPIFGASAASGIASSDITNWNTAYGWGDHSTEGYLKTYNNEYTTGATFNGGNGIITFTRNDGDTFTLDISSTLTDINVTGGTYNDGDQTLTLNKSDGGSINITGFAVDTVLHTTGATFNTSNGVVTFTKNGGDTYTVDLDGRFLTSFTETDPVFDAHVASNITSTNISNWNTAYGWGDHSLVGYLTAHPNISAASSSNNSGRTYIQDILLDSNGHVTGLTTSSETVVNTDEFTTGATFNDNNGVVTFTRNDGDTYSVDLDGRYLTSFTESDPVFTASAASGIASSDITNWNTAYGWGDHSVEGYLKTYNDEYTTGATFNTSNGVITFTRNDGDTFTVDIDGRFLTSFTESDPVFTASAASGIQTSDITNWNTAYGWGDHSLAGYLIAHPNVNAATSSNNSGRTYIQDILLDSNGHVTGLTTASESVVNTDEFTTGATFNTSNGVITFTRNDGDTFTVDIDGRFLTSFTETDPVFTAHVASNITSTNISNWNTAYGWGDHSLVGYLTSLPSHNHDERYYTEDEIDNFFDGTTSITGYNRSNWNTAYGWGDHSLAGYLTAHPNISAASSSNNSGRTYIQDILLDSNGHVTGITTASESVVNTDEFVTGATFNNSNAVLTFTRNDGDTFTVTLLDTLSDVTVTGGTYNSGDQTLTLTKSDGNTVDVSGFAIDTDVNYYLDGLSFNSSNGILTASVNGTSDQTVDLDGRYVELGGGTMTGGLITTNLQVHGGSSQIVLKDTSDDDDHSILFRNNSNNDDYKITTKDFTSAATGDGLYIGSTSGDNVALVTNNTTALDIDTSQNSVFAGTVTATSFIKSGGSSSQFLKADGSVDNSTYLTSHPNISAASSSDNTGRTYIQDILLDSNGHVTGVTTATETVDNTDTNYFLESLSFNTSNGILTAGLSGTSDVTVDLDGRYLTSYTESDTLDSVVGRGSITSNNITINGLRTNADSTYNIGTTSKRFLNIFTDEVTTPKIDNTLAAYTEYISNQGHRFYIDKNNDDTSHKFQILSNTETYNASNVIVEIDQSGNATFDGNISGNNLSGTNTGDQDLSAYLTSESDTLATVTSRGAATTTPITLQGALTLAQSNTSTVISGNSSGNLTIDNNTGSIAFQANGSTINSMTITSSLITLNENVQANGNIDMGTNVITDTKVGQWDTAYGWGDHSLGGYLTAHPNVNAASSSNNSGRTYIQDVLLDSNGHVTGLTTASESVVNTDEFTTGATFNTSNGIITFTRNDGDTYTVDIDGRFLTSFTESDPVFTASAASGIASSDITNWNTAYGWGDHSLAGYLTSSSTQSKYLRSDTDDTTTGTLTIGDGSNQARLKLQKADNDTANHIEFYNGTTRVGEIGVQDSTWLRINQETNKNIYTPRYIRSDGGFFVDGTSKGINGSGNFIGGTIVGASDANVTNWDTAYGWGDHSLEGYVKNDEYTTGATFNGSNGIITFTRNDGDTYTLDISSTLTDVNVTGGTYSDATQTLTLNKSNGTSINVTGFAVDTVLHTTGATFNSSNGVITFTKNGGDTYTVDIDGRFLTSYTETDTLDSVTDRDATTNNDLTVGGLTISDTFPYLDFVDTNSFSDTADRFRVRAGGNNGMIQWSDSSAGTTTTLMTFLPDGKITMGNGIQFTATGGVDMGTNTITDTKVGQWNTAYGWGDHSQAGYLTSESYTEHENISAASSSDNSGRTYIQDILLDSNGHVTGITTASESVVNTNNYADSLSFNTANGILTLGRSGLTDLTVDLDGRYLTSFTETNSFLGDGGVANTHPGTNKLIFTGQVSSGSGVLGMPAVDNSNAFLNINRHSGEYNSQLGFSSNGHMYYRSFSNTAINSTATWHKVYTENVFTNNSANWNTAYGWGDHSTAGYLTSSSTQSKYLRSDTADTFTGTITMGTQKALVANNYGRGVYGLYSASRYQHVWSMGTAYNLSDDGTSTGNLYGLAFTHTNVGGQSKSGLAHQLLIMDNGVTKSAIGRGIWTDGTITASGDLVLGGGDISASSTSSNVNVFASQTGTVTYGGGVVFVGSAANTTTIQGAMVVNENFSTAEGANIGGDLIVNGGDLEISKDGNYSTITFPAQTNDPGFIRHYESNNTAAMQFSVSDDSGTTDRFEFGYSGQADRFIIYSNGAFHARGNGAIEGHFTPHVNDTYDLGSSSKVWRNIYTGDLHLSNMGKSKGNDVDGTKGNWTIQEGAENLYIINNNNGKKFRVNLEEV